MGSELSFRIGQGPFCYQSRGDCFLCGLSTFTTISYLPSWLCGGLWRGFTTCIVYHADGRIRRSEWGLFGCFRRSSERRRTTHQHRSQHTTKKGLRLFQDRQGHQCAVQRFVCELLSKWKGHQRNSLKFTQGTRGWGSFSFQGNKLQQEQKMLRGGPHGCGGRR